jgi:mannose-6-phosphate isomerase-like protein (cupin superfamily)
MPISSQEIWFENPLVGQRSRIITLPAEMDGRGFVVEYINKPFGGQNAVPAHVHSAYTETFQILEGRARYRLGSDTKTAVAGDRVVMPPNVPHVHPWSDSAEELHVRQTGAADPPDLAGLNATIQAAITIQGLAKAGRVNAKGLPNLFQLAVLVETTMPGTYLAGPPIALQRLLFGTLGRVGRLAGYRTAYPEFGVLTADGLTVPASQSSAA